MNAALEFRLSGFSYHGPIGTVWNLAHLGLLIPLPYSHRRYAARSPDSAIITLQYVQRPLGM